MKLDNLVRKRFDELKAKAESIYQQKEFDFQNENGKAYFTVPSAPVKGWGTSVLNLIQRAFGEDSAHYRNFMDHFNNYDGWESSLNTLVAIFDSAQEDYEGGYLFNVQSLVKAEVLDDALEQAKSLLSAGYKDPAAVLIGVSLETALKDLCQRESIQIGKLDKMNTELYKAGIYNMAKQKQITAWADIRNKAAHGEWSAYTNEDIKEYMDGVSRFIADYM